MITVLKSILYVLLALCSYSMYLSLVSLDYGGFNTLWKEIIVFVLILIGLNELKNK